MWKTQMVRWLADILALVERVGSRGEMMPLIRNEKRVCGAGEVSARKARAEVRRDGGSRALQSSH